MTTKNKITDFFGEVFVEMKRITWPTQKEAFNYTVTVIIFILIASTFLGLTDVVIQALLNKFVLNQ